MTHQVHTKIQINLVEWSTHFARAILHPFYGDNRHHGANNSVDSWTICNFMAKIMKFHFCLFVHSVSIFWNEKFQLKNLILEQKCNSHQPRKWQQQQQLQWMKRKFVDLLFRFKYEHITVTVDAKWQKCEKQNSKHKNGFLLG